MTHDRQWVGFLASSFAQPAAALRDLKLLLELPNARRLLRDDLVLRFVRRVHVLADGLMRCDQLQPTFVRTQSS